MAEATLFEPPCAVNRVCKSCGTSKPLSEFPYCRSRDWHYPKCKTCHYKYIAATRPSEAKPRAPKPPPTRVTPAGKRCPGCDTTKPASDFCRQPAAADGLAGKCKKCEYDQRRRHRLSRAAKWSPDIIPPRKYCKACHSWKPSSEFSIYRYSADGLAWHCRECWRLQSRRYDWKLTQEEWDALVQKCDGRCTICRQPSSRLDVDHCHDTGRIRGLLCPTCNRGLGQFKDDPRRLLSAIPYLCVGEVS